MNNSYSNARDAKSKEDNESIAENNNQLTPVKNLSNRRRSFENELLNENANGRPLSCFQITYNELRDATNNWDPATILGKGGFGIVFKGKNKKIMLMFSN